MCNIMTSYNQTGKNSVSRRRPSEEELAIFFAYVYTGVTATPEQVERAKERRERRNNPFMRQTQLELDLIDEIGLPVTNTPTYQRKKRQHYGTTYRSGRLQRHRV